MAYFVYIMANKRNGTLYVGMTNDLIRRVNEHRTDQYVGFTKKHRLHLLVHWEMSEDVLSAIMREKQLKWWQRKWKLRLIENTNPEWRDLFDELL
jgi:putative endonuclease